MSHNNKDENFSSSDDDDEEEEVEETEKEQVTDLSNSDVCTKYQEAAKIVNLALEGLISQCQPGAKIVNLCQFGTTVIESQTGKLYNKKNKLNGQVVEKGVAFPVCISVNKVVCNHSPLLSEELPPLEAGDIVKIDLGCHIDGYIAVAAHTLVVPAAAVDGGEPPAPAPSTELSNVAVAAYHAMLVAAAALKAGAKNTDVTKAVERVATHYGVTPISSVRMHQMKRFVMDGVKEVALKEPAPEDLVNNSGIPFAGAEEKVPECTFEQAEVYAVDVAMSTGDGKARPGDLRTTVFKRNVESNYRLKMKASRYVLSEIDKKFPTLPFTLRHFEDERQAKMGINECVSHGLLTPYPSLVEKAPGAKVAHFKCTVLLLASGTTKVTGLAMPDYFEGNNNKEPDEETAKVLAEIAEKAAKKAKKKAQKKKKKAAANK